MTRNSIRIWNLLFFYEKRGKNAPKCLWRHFVDKKYELYPNNFNVPILFQPILKGNEGLEKNFFYLLQQGKEIWRGNQN